jgi:hypothetical protein
MCSDMHPSCRGLSYKYDRCIVLNKLWKIFNDVFNNASILSRFKLQEWSLHSAQQAVEDL